MSSKTRLLFDTHAFIAFFNREEGSERIRTYFETIQIGDTVGFVATITLAELAYIYTRKANAPFARHRVLQVQHSKLNILPLSAEIAMDAGTIKRPGISVADAIIAASARSVNATVVTNDPHFSIMGVEVTRYP